MVTFTQEQAIAHELRVSGKSAEPSAENATEREADLHSQIMADCRRRGWVFFHGSMASETHRTEGEPDFLILASCGRTFLVECKSRTGKLSVKQQAIKHQANNLGHTVHIVRSYQQYLEIIR